MPGSKQSSTIAKILQWILNAGLLMLAVILVVFLGKETFTLGTVLFNASETASSYLLIEGIPFPAALFYLHRHNRDYSSDYR